MPGQARCTIGKLQFYSRAACEAKVEEFASMGAVKVNIMIPVDEAFTLQAVLKVKERHSNVEVLNKHLALSMGGPLDFFRNLVTRLPEGREVGYDVGSQIGGRCCCRRCCRLRRATAGGCWGSFGVAASRMLILGPDWANLALRVHVPEDPFPRECRPADYSENNVGRLEDPRLYDDMGSNAEIPTWRFMALNNQL